MPLDYQRLKDWKFSEQRISYTARDTILYALGIGYGDQSSDPAHLQYLLEDRLVAFPTYASVVSEDSDWPALATAGVTFSHMVHAEQAIQIHAPMPGAGTLIVQSGIDEIVDKGPGRGAIIYFRRSVRAENGTLLASSMMATFCRADGGFNGPVTKSPDPHPMPTGAPEVAVDLPVSVRAALIYRLSGDRNMLHADPEFATAVGFPKPILHGMCSYAMAGRAIIQHYGQNNASILRSLQTRFSAPVFAGETLRTEMWRNGNVVSFRTRAVERDIIVLNHGKAELNA